MAAGLIDAPLDWLLYSDFAVLVGLVTSYMPFMIFPLWLSLAGIDRRLIEASCDARCAARHARSCASRCRLSLPGVFAAAIFGFVGCFGESAVPIIMGGVGYQLIGNTITSSHGRAELSAGRRDVDRRAAGDAEPAARSGIWPSTCGAFLGKILRLARVTGDASQATATRFVSWCGLIIGSCLLFIYLPLVPPILFSVAPAERGAADADACAGMSRCGAIPLLVARHRHLARGRRRRRASRPPSSASSPRWRSASLRVPRLILALMLLPLFVPGVSMGLATAFFFRLLGIRAVACHNRHRADRVGAAVRDPDRPDRHVDLRSGLSRGRLYERRRTLARLSWTSSCR